MEIRWSPQAAEDLERVVRRIQSDNLTAAGKVADTIYTSVTNSKNFPHRGRIARIARTPLSVLAIHCRLSRETRRRRDRTDLPRLSGLAINWGGSRRSSPEYLRSRSKRGWEQTSDVWCPTQNAHLLHGHPHVLCGLQHR